MLAIFTIDTIILRLRVEEEASGKTQRWKMKGVIHEENYRDHGLIQRYISSRQDSKPVILDLNPGLLLLCHATVFQPLQLKAHWEALTRGYPFPIIRTPTPASIQIKEGQMTKPGIWGSSYLKWRRLPVWPWVIYLLFPWTSVSSSGKIWDWIRWSQSSGFCSNDPGLLYNNHTSHPNWKVRYCLLSEPESLTTLRTLLCRSGGRRMRKHLGNPWEGHDASSISDSVPKQLWCQVIFSGGYNICGAAKIHNLDFSELKCSQMPLDIEHTSAPDPSKRDREAFICSVKCITLEGKTKLSRMMTKDSWNVPSLRGLRTSWNVSLSPISPFLESQFSYLSKHGCWGHHHSFMYPG